MYVNANQIYSLLQQEQITSGIGNITFNFKNIAISIRGKNAIGDLFQEWLEAWMTRSNISYRKPSNTQEFPDFLLHRRSNEIDLLEIKLFDYDRSPNFDVANFDSYQRSLLTNAYRLDADYLIFGYRLNNTGFSIADFWLKKVWEITGDGNTNVLKCQVKQGVIHNIRPVKWYSSRRVQSPFTSRFHFCLGLEQRLLNYNRTQHSCVNWLREVRANYRQHTGSPL
jgi:type II restriction enzyme